MVLAELEAKAAEELVAGAIGNVEGLRDVYSTSPNPNVVFDKIDAPEHMQKFVRTQKRHSGLQTGKLWAAENKSASERRGGKIASKQKKNAIAIDMIVAREVVVNYHTFKVSV